MPAGYGRRCRDCDGRERAHRRINALAATLEPARIAERFASIGKWLVETVKPERAARDATRYAAFFAEIGEKWGDIPDYAALVAHFSAEGLRRRRRALRWMIERELVSVDTAVRENDSERRRITTCLGRLREGSPAQKVIRDYHAVLEKRVRTGEMTLRSMRLGLTPAMGLLEAAQTAGYDLPTQETLDALLREVPGQRAALAGFVRWLRETREIAIALPPKSRTRALRRRRQTAREEMLSLLHKGAGEIDVDERWRIAALGYFHDVTMKAARAVRECDVETDRGGLQITIDGEGYWIPSPPKPSSEQPRE